MTSPALQEFLNQEDAEIILLGHHVFKPFMPYLQELARDRVIVWDMNTQNTQAVLSSADLMITDYSSASFDCAYMGIPVLYFQFDQDHFYQQRGGYFVDPDRELLGRVVRTREELLAEVLCVAERNWAADAEFAARIDLFFDHRDGNNCSRLYDAIQERVSVARRGKTKM
jgi:CDP-glycerol glycerophosphotransferase (TagB/SpsB family)